MMKSKIFFFVLVSFSFFTISCNKEEINSLVKELTLEERVKTLLDVMHRDYSGVMKIENTQIGFIEDNRRCIVSGTFIEDSPFSNSEMTIGDNSFNINQGHFSNRDLSYESYFGKKTNIGLTNSQRNLSEVGMYLPTSFTPELLSNNGGETPNFNTSSVINWNADAANEVGVYIVITYSPGWNTPDIATQKETKTHKFIHTEDTGSYTFNADNFSDIPNDALVLIRLIRGDYRIIENGADEYLVYATSEIQGFARKQ